MPGLPSVGRDGLSRRSRRTSSRTVARGWCSTTSRSSARIDGRGARGPGGRAPEPVLGPVGLAVREPGPRERRNDHRGPPDRCGRLARHGRREVRDRHGLVRSRDGDGRVDRGRAPYRGVDSTPTLVVGGRRLVGGSYAAWPPRSPMPRLADAVAARPNPRLRPGLLLAALDLVGLVVAIYLSSVELRGDLPYCGPLHGCETVALSPYSRIAGVPVAVFGVMLSLSLLTLAIAWIRSGRLALLAGALRPLTRRRRLRGLLHLPRGRRDRRGLRLVRDVRPVARRAFRDRPLDMGPPRRLRVTDCVNR